ncbi:MAG: PTS system mannose/fructose/sorbose family transporter subunit IID [Deferribacterales bacterium]|nr:PTS system mannose/fructose/sorbose family transporter subunit IID [Deferribacterales bacterium]
MKKPIFLPTIFKSMFFQANWNMDNMQGTGFSWLIKDLLKRNCIKCPEDFTNASRVPSYFNTNPYLITFILGMFMKECEENGKPADYCKTYASAFAALGDSFFWHSLRPFTFLLSIWIAVVNPDLAVLFYLILYNFFHIGFRFLGLYYGYKFGKNVILIFRRIAFNRWTQIFDSVSTFMAGVTLAVAVKYISASQPIPIIKASVLFLSGIVAANFVKTPIAFMCVAAILGVMLMIGM